MTWRSHALIGADTAMLAVAFWGYLPPEPGLVAAAAAVGALLPDLDSADSKARHLISAFGIEPLAPVSGILNAVFGHRGFMHSALGLLCFSAAVAALGALLRVNWQDTAALCLGYASHLLADACTPSGIPLWYPIRGRVHALPGRLLIVTGSAAEDALMPLLALPILALLLRRL